MRVEKKKTQDQNITAGVLSDTSKKSTANISEANGDKIQDMSLHSLQNQASGSSTILKKRKPRWTRAMKMERKRLLNSTPGTLKPEKGIGEKHQAQFITAPQSSDITLSNDQSIISNKCVIQRNVLNDFLPLTSISEQPLVKKKGKKRKKNKGQEHPLEGMIVSNDKAAIAIKNEALKETSNSSLQNMPINIISASKKKKQNEDLTHARESPLKYSSKKFDQIREKKKPRWSNSMKRERKLLAKSSNLATNMDKETKDRNQIHQTFAGTSSVKDCMQNISANGLTEMTKQRDRQKDDANEEEETQPDGHIKAIVISKSLADIFDSYNEQNGTSYVKNCKQNKSTIELTEVTKKRTDQKIRHMKKIHSAMKGISKKNPPMKKKNISKNYVGMFDRPKNPPTKIYVDILNYKQKFFVGKASWEASYKLAKKRVNKFVEAARKSGLEIEVFIDQAIETKEVAKKWISRRVKQIEKSSMRLVPCSNLFGDFFRQNGVPVHYSTKDNDDTIAAFAFRDKAAILSGDSDFFRYRTKTSKAQPYYLYKDYKINQDGYLELFNNNGKRKSSWRMLCDPVPETNPNTFLGLLSSMNDSRLDVLDTSSAATQCYIRGNASCLTIEAENLYLTAKPLRQAVYSRLKTGLVHEIIPTWKNNHVQWVCQDTEENSALDNLLDDPKTALERVFENSVIQPLRARKSKLKDFRLENHKFAQKLVVAELCAWASGSITTDVLDKLI